jgi:hypothetical protein
MKTRGAKNQEGLRKKWFYLYFLIKTENMQIIIKFFLILIKIIMQNTSFQFI